MFIPSRFAITSGRPYALRCATTELVVPRSMPTKVEMGRSGILSDRVNDFGEEAQDLIDDRCRVVDRWQGQNAPGEPGPAVTPRLCGVASLHHSHPVVATHHVGWPRAEGSVLEPTPVWPRPYNTTPRSRIFASSEAGTRLKRSNRSRLLMSTSFEMPNSLRHSCALTARSRGRSPLSDTTTNRS